MEDSIITEIAKKAEGRFRIIRSLIGHSDNMFLNLELNELQCLLQDLVKLSTKV